ncbi:hypothetical protein HC891_23730 [Candidatus Gracilibacteria bacterium]|nr:hypothetical protein [Candidatus Gracilibacteria bacterium]
MGDPIAGRILFVRDAAIWLWQGERARLLLGDGATQPSWAPDGTRFAFVQRGNSFSDVLLATNAGEVIAQLTFNESQQAPNSFARAYESVWAFYPAWSPDGQEIVMASQASPPVGDPAAEYNLALYVLPVGDGAQRPLFAGDTVHSGRAHYARDGSGLVFAAVPTAADGTSQLYWLDFSSGIHTPLAGLPQPAYDPALSPDGAWLIFAAASAAGVDIFATTPDGTEAIQLSQHGSARAPVFSPDGTQVAFLAAAPGTGFDLWLADFSLDEQGFPSLGQPRRISDGLNLDPDGGLSWAP